MQIMLIVKIKKKKSHFFEFGNLNEEMKCDSVHNSLKIPNMHFQENGNQMLSSEKKKS